MDVVDGDGTLEFCKGKQTESWRRTWREPDDLNALGGKSKSSASRGRLGHAQLFEVEDSLARARVDDGIFRKRAARPTPLILHAGPHQRPSPREGQNEQFSASTQ
ncbi:hypothetical protein ACOXH8_16790 [Nannocystis pusilla]